MKLIVTSILAFISTNIDDVFLLMLFFGNKKFKDREIVTGQLLGIGALIAVSLVLSSIGLLIGKAFIGLLGLLPIYFGLRGVINLFKKNDKEDDQVIESKESKSNILLISGVTIANGGDNIVIYLPLFATLLWPEKFIMTTLFFVMTLFWCVLAKYFIKHPLVARVINKYGHVVTPFVLILLGVYILYESNTLSLLQK